MSNTLLCFVLLWISAPGYQLVSCDSCGTLNHMFQGDCGNGKGRHVRVWLTSSNRDIICRLLILNSYSYIYIFIPANKPLFYYMILYPYHTQTVLYTPLSSRLCIVWLPCGVIVTSNQRKATNFFAGAGLSVYTNYSTICKQPLIFDMWHLFIHQWMKDRYICTVCLCFTSLWLSNRFFWVPLPKFSTVSAVSVSAVTRRDVDKTANLKPKQLQIVCIFLFLGMHCNSRWKFRWIWSHDIGNFYIYSEPDETMGSNMQLVMM